MGARWWPTAGQCAVGFVGLNVAAAVAADVGRAGGPAAGLAGGGIGVVVVAAVVGGWYRGTRRAWVAEHRRRVGRCVQCGYDRHESVDRCGECATWVPAGHRTTSDAVAALGEVGDRLEGGFERDRG